MGAAGTTAIGTPAMACLSSTTMVGVTICATMTVAIGANVVTNGIVSIAAGTAAGMAGTVTMVAMAIMADMTARAAVTVMVAITAVGNKMAMQHLPPMAMVLLRPMVSGAAVAMANGAVRAAAAADGTGHWETMAVPMQPLSPTQHLSLHRDVAVVGDGATPTIWAEPSPHRARPVAMVMVGECAVNRAEAAIMPRRRLLRVRLLRRRSLLRHPLRRHQPVSQRLMAAVIVDMVAAICTKIEPYHTSLEEKDGRAGGHWHDRLSVGTVGQRGGVLP